MHRVNVIEQGACERTIRRLDNHQFGFLFLINIWSPMLPGFAYFMCIIRINCDMDGNDMIRDRTSICQTLNGDTIHTRNGYNKEVLDIRWFRGDVRCAFTFNSGIVSMYTNKHQYKQRNQNNHYPGTGGEFCVGDNDGDKGCYKCTCTINDHTVQPALVLFT